MELAVKSQPFPVSTGERKMPRNAASPLDKAYRDMLARRAKEQHEFRIQRSNLTNPLVNMFIL